MTFRLHLGLGLLTVVGLGVISPAVAQAATANCMSPDGTCEISNDGFDSIDCMCADGSGGGGGGGNAWAGLSEMELQPICEAELTNWCGIGLPPPVGVPCSSPLGNCIISNDPVDSMTCECANGLGGGFGGGNAWAGLSDIELLGICESEIPTVCGPFPAVIPCGTANGICEISNEPDSIFCECADGSDFGMGGGMEWDGLTEPELVTICEEIVDLECGGVPPPPPGLECSNRLGSCEISNDPEDSITCECVDGTGFGGGEGSEWAGLTDDELEMICLEHLNDGCGDDPEGTTSGEGTGEGSGESGAESGETGGSSGETGGGSSGGGTGGSSSETGGGSSETGGATDTEGGSGGSEGGAEGGGGGCSIAPGHDHGRGGAMLMLLGLLGLGWRRRRGA